MLRSTCMQRKFHEALPVWNSWGPNNSAIEHYRKNLVRLFNHADLLGFLSIIHGRMPNCTTEPVLLRFVLFWLKVSHNKKLETLWLSIKQIICRVAKRFKGKTNHWASCFWNWGVLLPPPSCACSYSNIHLCSVGSFTSTSMSCLPKTKRCLYAFFTVARQMEATIGSSFHKYNVAAFKAQPQICQMQHRAALVWLVTPVLFAQINKAGHTSGARHGDINLWAY